MTLTCLDLFSGIGGFTLGFERAGIKTTQFCEIDPYAQRVLAKHWPNIPIHSDIRSLHGEPGQYDVICGGFPCQDISYAGLGAGIDGPRSGLWREFRRIIAEVKPEWVVVENVQALCSRGLDTAIGALFAFGYDAEWHCIPAGAVGAPQRRDRVWIVGYTGGQRRYAFRNDNPENDRSEFTAAGSNPGKMAAPLFKNIKCDGVTWATEPDVGRVAYGVSARVDRLRCLGNAVVPQIAEVIGRAIMGTCSQ